MVIKPSIVDTERRTMLLEDYLALLVMPIITGLTVVLMEYWVIKPRRDRHERRNSWPQMGQAGLYSEEPARESPVVDTAAEDNSDSIIAKRFRTIAVLLIGGTAGLTIAILIKYLSSAYFYPSRADLMNFIANPLAHSDFIFLVTAIIAVLAGSASALVIDSSEISESRSHWGRYILALVVGLLGAALGCIVIPIILIALAVWASSKIDTSMPNAEATWQQSGEGRGVSSSGTGTVIVRQGNSGSTESPKAAFTIEDCRFCQGKGRYPIGERCPACGGKGSVPVYAPARKCSFCQGRGRAVLVGRCEACGGTGWAHVIRE